MDLNYFESIANMAIFPSDCGRDKFLFEQDSLAIRRSIANIKKFPDYIEVMICEKDPSFADCTAVFSLLDSINCA